MDFDQVFDAALDPRANRGIDVDPATETGRLEELAYERGYIIAVLDADASEPSENTPVAVIDFGCRNSNLVYVETLRFGEAEEYIQERSG